MSRGYKIILVLLVLLLALLTFLEASEPQEINWSPSYSSKDKIPLGTYVLSENLKDQTLNMKSVNVPPFEFLKDSNLTGTYFFLNNHLYIDEPEFNRLLSWVSKGNTAFLIAEDFSENILDTLNLELKITPPKKGISSKPFLNFTDSTLKSAHSWTYDRETYNVIFQPKDSIETEVLGTSHLRADASEEEHEKINFLRVSFGRGALYMHSTPKAFSNYFLLSGRNSDYAERALAYIPKEKTLLWDQYYKTGKSFNTSPLYILLNNRQLKWAYYFLIFGALFFVLFEGKRKQRSIPVLKPLQNQTYNFTRTIAGLYLDRKDYKSIATKKIALFLEYVRTRFRVATDKRNDDFFQRLASFSGNSFEEVKQLWTQIDDLEKKQAVRKNDLLNLNKAITAFKSKNNG